MKITRLAAVLFLGVFVGCAAPTGPASLLTQSSTTPSGPTVPADPVVPGVTVPAEVPGDLVGNYTITLTAADCDSNFPAEFVTRRYQSRLDRTTTGVALKIFQRDGGTTVDPVLRGMFAPPDRMTLTSYVGNEQWEGLFEQVTPTNLVSILVDEMKVTAAPQGMSGTFEGVFLLYLGSQGNWPHTVARCRSRLHTVNVMR